MSISQAEKAKRLDSSRFAFGGDSSRKRKKRSTSLFSHIPRVLKHALTGTTTGKPQVRFEDCNSVQGSADENEHLLMRGRFSHATEGWRLERLQPTYRNAAIVFVVLLLLWQLSTPTATSDIFASITTSLPATIAYSRDLLTLAAKRGAIGKAHVLPLVEAVIGSREAKLSAPPRDFALSSEGARVDCSLTSNCAWHHVTLPGLSTSPALALSPAIAIASCWNIRSLPAQLGIQLWSPVHPTHVTIDHLPRAFPSSVDARQTPRSMVLWGVLDGSSRQDIYRSIATAERSATSSIVRVRPHIHRDHQYALLASFVYDAASTASSQTFPIIESLQHSQLDFSLVVLEVIDGWGGGDVFLCRVRIHGEPVEYQD